MRRDCSHLLPLITILLLFPAPSHGQAWSSILASSRAINWTSAGLPATLPDGETTPNPWTPPTRTQCGSTISASGDPTTDTTNVNNALAACASGHYVLLAAGSFTFNSNIIFYTQNGVTLRGSGAQSTIVTLTGTAMIQMGGAYGTTTCTWTSGFAQGATSLTMSGCSGPTLVAGELALLQQCDTGFSGAGCTTGSSVDNGGLYVCGNTSACIRAGEGTGTPESQSQAVYVTSVTNKGGGSYTVNFTPGLYMPNWSSSNSPTVNATPGAKTSSVYGNGIEDMTLYNTGTANFSVNFNISYASWVKGVRFLGSGAITPLGMYNDKNSLVMNNYIFADVALGSNYPPAMQEGGDSDDLVINNFMTSGVPWEGTGSAEGNVVAYNYSRDTFTAYVIDFFEHNAGSAFMMYEGNQTGSFQDDDTHGTHDLNTWFRNYISGWEEPYVTLNPAGITWDSFARFENAVGNSIGSAQLTNYQSTWSDRLPSYAYSLDSTSSAHDDPLVQATALRWGNCDTVTGTCRFQSSEVPTALTGNAVPFQNSVPSNNNLPCSFFLPTYTSTNCTPTYSGGTGLSFWKVCTSWTAFPTSCATTETPAFPIAGPDITGGPYVNGHAYDNPASIAFQKLPIDPAYQKSYSITGSSWSSGTETLTVSGLPNTTHLMGGFQITGASACNSPTGGEFLMTGSSSTTVSYALASNPGSCAGGTMKFPDVRQFDERVYQNDAGSSDSPPAPPTGLAAQVD